MEAGQNPGALMARLSLSYEECKALREAALGIPPRIRSAHLVTALRVLNAVLAAVKQGREMLDGDGRPPTPADPAS
jgi:hypothetical protein